jgi:SAM-dependent methyltransferase
MPMADPMQRHCKLCDRADFGDGELRRLIREIYPRDRERSRETPGKRWFQRFPSGSEDRRYWETAMSVRAFDSLGVLRDDAELLGIGASADAEARWLTGRARRVFASDLDPAEQWEGPWNPRRLVVQPMDPRELRYEDDSMSGVFCAGAIERFDSLDQARRCVEEIHRVLRDGGVATIVVPYRLDGSADRASGRLIFDEQRLPELYGGLLWTLAGPLDTNASDPLVSREDGEAWTSAHLALVKVRHAT